MTSNIDINELVKRVLKYLIEGLVVGGAMWLLGKKQDFEAVLSVALVASATFALLDLAAPSIGASARTGAGYGIGFNLVGFPKA